MSIEHVGNGLHISSIRSVQSHDTSKFDLVVSVCQDACPQNVSDETPYDHFELADDETSEENWGGSSEYSEFADAAENVTYALQADAIENVLVHCHAGQNRSCAVCAAALAVHNQRSYEWAFNKIRAARPIVNPNQTMRSHAKRFILEHS